MGDIIEVVTRGIEYDPDTGAVLHEWERIDALGSPVTAEEAQALADDRYAAWSARVRLNGREALRIDEAGDRPNIDEWEVKAGRLSERAGKVPTSAPALHARQ